MACAGMQAGDSTKDWPGCKQMTGCCCFFSLAAPLVRTFLLHRTATATATATAKLLFLRLLSPGKRDRERERTQSPLLAIFLFVAPS